jgi:hypothetical protein
VKVALTQRQAEMLEKLAARQNTSLRELLNKEVNAHVLSLLK